MDLCLSTSVINKVPVWRREFRKWTLYTHFFGANCIQKSMIAPFVWDSRIVRIWCFIKVEKNLGFKDSSSFEINKLCTRQQDRAAAAWALVSDRRGLWSLFCEVSLDNSEQMSLSEPQCLFLPEMIHGRNAVIQFLTHQWWAARLVLSLSPMYLSNIWQSQLCGTWLRPQKEAKKGSK